MSQDKDSGPEKQAGEQIFKNCILLALPWLALQRDMLAIGKRGIQDYSHVRPLQNFALREMQALTMALDPSRKWRDSYAGLDSKLEEVTTEGISKFMASLSAMLESQETIVNGAIEALNTVRTGKTKPAE
jgi:hypothetical protein